MTDETNQPEKKIIVDEDWKRRVEAEREAAAQGPTPPEPAPSPAAEEHASPAEAHLPEPGLSYLASTLYLQAAIALGMLPNPVTGKSEVRLTHAKHAIDTLEILQQKTEGNRTQEETDELEAILHQVRLGYIQLRG